MGPARRHCCCLDLGSRFATKMRLRFAVAAALVAIELVASRLLVAIALAVAGQVVVILVELMQPDLRLLLSLQCPPACRSLHLRQPIQTKSWPLTLHFYHKQSRLEPLGLRKTRGIAGV